jgi:hypothetical protein
LFLAAKVALVRGTSSVVMVVMVVLSACGPMALPPDPEAASTSLHGSTGAPDTEVGDSLGGCTLPTSAQDTEGGTPPSTECTPIEWTPIDEPAFTGRFACEAMPESTVFEHGLHVAAHHEIWCEMEQACQSPPPPPCEPPPELPELGERIVYVYGAASGCAIQATIEEILDCGDEIEVHYRLGAPGCDVIIHTWASASIPCGPAPVVFIQNG